MGGGGGGGSGPTVQQQQLETQQAISVANLNLEENAQRKSIINALQGTRVFRGSALSRAVAGNTSGGLAPPGGPSPSRNRGGTMVNTASILDPSVSAPATGSGATPAGGAGASGAGGGAGSYRGGGGQGGRSGVRTP